MDSFGIMVTEIKKGTFTMNICIFDTETTSVEKPFCYNIGYVIYDLDNGIPLLKKNFVCEQVWHNPMLFTTAYYADKRDFYISEMRKRTAIMNKYGYICQEMIRDFKNFEISMAFAYNSSFDERVFSFNCDWFKCNNPFDNVEVKDIRGFAHRFLVDDEFKVFCEQNQYFSESGNYSSTAEVMYRYITKNIDFVEAHTALDDSEIESEILLACIEKGADVFSEYKSLRSIERKQTKTLHIKTAEQTDFYFDYEKIRVNKDKTEITLK